MEGEARDSWMLSVTAPDGFWDLRFGFWFSKWTHGMEIPQIGKGRVPLPRPPRGHPHLPGKDTHSSLSSFAETYREACRAETVRDRRTFSELYIHPCSHRPKAKVRDPILNTSTLCQPQSCAKPAALPNSLDTAQLEPSKG